MGTGLRKGGSDSVSEDSEGGARARALGVRGARALGAASARLAAVVRAAGAAVGLVAHRSATVAHGALPMPVAAGVAPLATVRVGHAAVRAADLVVSRVLK